MSELNVGDLNISQNCNFAVYASANRPVGVDVGFIIFNSDESKLQVWDGSNWVSFGQSSYDMSGSGNVTTTDLTGDFSGYRVLKFTGNGTLNVTQSNQDGGIEMLLIAGGGGGGGVIGGGGGAGGVIYRRSLYLAPGSYSINIGGGGEGGRGWNNSEQEGRAGTPSTFIGGDTYYEAVGGGGGCGHGGSTPNRIGGNGGSGGGSANIFRRGGNAIGNNTGPLEIVQSIRSVYAAPANNAMASNTILQACTAVQGNEGDAFYRRGVQGYPGGNWGDGDAGAGGGGAGGAGIGGGRPRDVGGPGGSGIFNRITGSEVGYAGGGGGGTRGTGRRRSEGGAGGGGKGGRNSLAPASYGGATGEQAEAGQVNTGGGGGGGGYNGSSSSIIGAPGGPGICIIRFKRT